MDTENFKYILIANDWNEGLSVRKLAKKYELTEHSIYFHLYYAGKRGIKLREKKPKYELVAQDWNRGLRRSEIARIHSISYQDVNSFLRNAKAHGIKVYSAAERKKIYSSQSEFNPDTIDQSSDINREYSFPFDQTILQIKKSILEMKDRRQQIIELLKEYKPIEVVKLLNISVKEVYDVIDLLSSEEIKQIKKAFVRNREYVFSRVKFYKNKGMKTIEALRKIEKEISIENISELVDVYFVMDLYSLIEKLLDRKLNMDDLDKVEIEYLSQLKVLIGAEIKYSKVRKEYKQLLESGMNISFNKLSEKYDIKPDSLIEILGREDNCTDGDRGL